MILKSQILMALNFLIVYVEDTHQEVHFFLIKKKKKEYIPIKATVNMDPSVGSISGETGINTPLSLIYMRF